MNAAQTSLYFFHWGKVRAYYLGKSIDPKQVDAKRHELHKKSLGVMKSSKDFTNADLDKVIATFRAIYDDANFAAQMRQLDQPEERRRALVARCWKAMGTFITDQNERIRQNKCEAYINGTAKRMFGAGYEQLPDTQLAQVMGALERSAAVKAKKREHAENPNPF